MKSYIEIPLENHIPMADFLKSYNENIPAHFPPVSVEILLKFKESHTTLFKNGDLWSLDQHRKKIIDWMHITK